MTTITAYRYRGRHREPSLGARLLAWLDRPVVAARVLTVTATAGAAIITGILGGAW